MFPLVLQKPKQDIVLKLDVSLLVRHLSLQKQVSQIPFLQKPLKKLPKRKLASYRLLSIVYLRLYQRRYVARSCDIFHPGNVPFTRVVTTAIIFFAQFFNKILKCRPRELTYYFLCYVPTNVLLVVTLVVLFLLFDFLKNTHIDGSEGLRVLIIVGMNWLWLKIVQIENQGPFLDLLGGTNKLPEKRIVGPGFSDIEEERLLIFVHVAVGLLNVDVLGLILIG